MKSALSRKAPAADSRRPAAGRPLLHQRAGRALLALAAAAWWTAAALPQAAAAETPGSSGDSSCITAAALQQSLTDRLQQSERLGDEIAALFALPEAQQQTIARHVSALAADEQVRAALALEIPADSEKCLSAETGELFEHKIITMLLTPGSLTAAAGMLRLPADDLKRLMIYHLTRAEFLDDEGCTAFLRGQGRLDPKADLQGLQQFFAAVGPAGLQDYLKLTAAAITAQAHESPEPRLLELKDVAAGHLLYSRALEKWRELNPETGARLARILQAGDQAAPADKCYADKTFMLIMLSLKGETGDLVLLSSLQQSTMPDYVKKALKQPDERPRLPPGALLMRPDAPEAAAETGAGSEAESESEAEAEAEIEAGAESAAQSAAAGVTAAEPQPRE